MVSTAFAQRQAQLSWWDRAPEKKVGHYWIKTDLANDQALAIARHLNIMYDEYLKRMANLPVRVEEKLNVMIFKSRQDYSFTLRARFGVNAEASGGMFFANTAGTALAFWVEGLPERRIEHVIQHEGFHQFAYSRFGDDLPIWLNEGLAELFGEAIVVGDRLVIGQTTPRMLDEMKIAVDANRHIAFHKMLNMTSGDWADLLKNDKTAPLAYRQAWSMVHFLIYGDGGQYSDSFNTYLKHLNTGLPSEQAFIRAFGPDVDAFENRWKVNVMAAKPSAFATALERIEFLAEGTLELSRRKVYPQSLDELKKELRDADFSFAQNTHAIAAKLSAEDERLFTIPMDDLCAEQPVFIVTKTKLMQATRHELALEKTNPTPATIATDHLRPMSLRINWLRDEEKNTFRYQIVVR
jgi:hypothetical protein